MICGLPEALTVPERHEVTRYAGELGAVSLQLTQKDGMQSYRYDEGVVYRDVLLDEAVIGDFCLGYQYPERVVFDSSVYVYDSEYRGKGIGSALYQTALDLPLPSGESPRDLGFVFESRYQSDMARRVMEGFVRRGIAERGSATDRHYVMR